MQPGTRILKFCGPRNDVIFGPDHCQTNVTVVKKKAPAIRLLQLISICSILLKVALAGTV